VCHGIDRAGSPPSFPTLIDIQKKLPDEKIAQTVKLGTGRMPSFPNIDDEHMTDLLRYLRSGDTTETGADKKELASAPAAGAAPPDARGMAVYKDKCAACHGDNREGVPDLGPTLMALGSRLNAVQVRKIIFSGKDKMPQIPDVIGKDMDALLRFLDVGEKVASVTPPVESEEGPYIFTGYRKFLDPEGYPAFIPPWGTLNAIDLNTGKYLWKIPFGEYPALAQQGMKNTGSENYGGPVVTAGGVLFIGATVYDRRFHVFDASNGKLLWETELPFAGMATPSTYMVDGRQYIVIASSGGRDPKSPVGGAYIAFALPGK
jgi:mono/diheme cytochrome c family protein